MNKILFLILSLIFIPVLSYAIDDVEEYCLKEPYPVHGSASKIISNITGANFIATKTIEANIQKSLKKDLNSSFNVEVYPFSLIDLASGKFKKITVEAPDINAPDFSLTGFKAESLCPYNRVIAEDGNLFFAENFLLGYSATITNTNLKKTVLSTKYLNMINKADINFSGVTFFKITEPNIEIKDNRLHLSFKLSYSNFFKNFEKTIKANTSLKVQDEKIVFTDIQIGERQGVSSNIILCILNVLNPFSTKIKIDDNNTAYVKTKDLEFIDNSIKTNGVVLLKKNYMAD